MTERLKNWSGGVGGGEKRFPQQVMVMVRCGQARTAACGKLSAGLKMKRLA